MGGMGNGWEEGKKGVQGGDMIEAAGHVDEPVLR